MEDQAEKVLSRRRAHTAYRQQNSASCSAGSAIAYGVNRQQRHDMPITQKALPCSPCDPLQFRQQKKYNQLLLLAAARGYAKDVSDPAGPAVPAAS